MAGIHIILLFACLPPLHATPTQCPDLVPVEGVTLSQVDSFIGDPAVTADCKTGHVFDTGELIKYIACVNDTSGNEWIAAWNDTVGNCIQKQCPDITSYLGDHMTASNYDMFSEYGDTATINCDPGYAFSVDLNANVTSRVTSSINVTCEDDTTSTTAVWSDMGTCSEIDCDSPPDVTASNMIYNSTTIGSRVIYECYSGYWFIYGIYAVGATCNGSADWETYNGPGWVLGYNVHCSKMEAYVGCLEPGSIDVLETAMTALGTTECKTYCKSRNYRYAAIESNQCSCGDFLESNYTENYHEECNTYCVDYTVNSTTIPPFCGGQNNLLSVYSSLAGCYKNLVLPDTGGELITEDYGITCSEFCRGKDDAVAAVNQGTCFCFNSTNIEGTETDKGKCSQVPEDVNGTSEFTMVYDIGKTVVTAKDCLELYAMGIRLHGNYYLAEPYRREYCHFKDGTQCERGWIGFDGYCYLFGAGYGMNFTDARNYCLSLDADLLSILTTEEHNFMKQTTQVFTDVLLEEDETKTWWLGLYDSMGTNLYTWLDGHVMSVSFFALGHPQEPSDCGAESDLYYNWFAIRCSRVINVFCKKPQGRTECKEFADPPISQYSFSDDSMTLTYCLEKCKGRNASYAVSQNQTCWCIDTIPLHINHTLSQCNTSCPGDPSQHCGGEMNNYRVQKVNSNITAKSCEDLQILGIGNDTYLTSTDTDPVLAYCVYPQCPYSWVSIGHHCYKFYPRMTYSEAFETCARSDSYLTTIETVEEMNLLVSTATNITIYSTTDAWRLGLQGLSIDGHGPRWSNGYPYNPDQWNTTLVLVEGPQVILQMNTSDWVAQSFSEQAFICERGLDYIGCYNKTNATGDVEYYHDKMTIQQCVELCRAKNRSFAFVSINACLCENTLTQKVSGKCIHECAGQFNQVCGADGLASVYNVSEFVPFAFSCDDLFNQGIFKSDYYIVNGSLTTCVFKDWTSCPSGWFGYQGQCYKHFFNSQSDTCTTEGSTMTSLTSLDELTVLQDYLKFIQFALDTKYLVLTGVTYGLYEFNVTISQDGLLVDPDLLSHGYIDVMDLHNHGSLTLHNTDGADGDGGTICKKDKYVVGCFTKPDSIITPPIISDFPSMELTLCKQTCIGLRSEVALMGLLECYCMNATDLWSLSNATSAACEQPCALVPEQTCGNGSVVWAYLTADDEVPLADNCSGLYQGGVFLKQVYKLNNPHRYETCGFTDTTPCPVSWFGENNKCLKIITVSSNLNSARAKCSKEGGFLFNPIDSDINLFLEKLFIDSSLFDSITHWRTGLYPVFYNASYVTSRGEMVVSALFGPGASSPDSSIYYDSQDQSWYGKQTKMEYICERDDDYIDCVSIHDTESNSYDDSGNSLTMCIYWCSGQDFSYSAVSNTVCKCYQNDITTFTSHSGSCTSHCPGVSTQICGESNHHYYTYVRTEQVSVMPSTCMELYLHGVFIPGYYWLDIDGYNISVECFTGGALTLQSFNALKSVHASSTLSGHDVSQASFAYPFSEAWKPHENVEGTWFILKQASWYLVAGISMAGLHTHTEQSYVTSYSVAYRNLLSGFMETFPYNSTDDVWPGCSSSYDVCSSYPTDPVVTTEIVLYPHTWQEAIAMQIAIYGQFFANFNHLEPYLGCYLDGNDSFSVVAGVNTSLDDCLDVCRNSSKQFAGINEMDECLCGDISATYGFVSDTYCPQIDVENSKRRGTDVHNIRALYRTFTYTVPYYKSKGDSYSSLYRLTSRILAKEVSQCFNLT